MTLLGFNSVSAMKTLRQTVSESEDLRPITEVNKRTKTGDCSVLIPVDLIFEIFVRLPMKSIARCHCVSKRWASIPRLPYFTELFLKRSLARPQLLFVCKRGDHVFFFSTRQPQSLDKNSSLLTTNCYRMKVLDDIFDIKLSSIRGLVFLNVLVSKGKGNVLVICNPSTAQSSILPQVKSKMGVRSYLGYDPVEKQYKVLSMKCAFNESRWLMKHQVLTLGGSGELLWRKIECSIPYFLNYKNHHICIDGVLYYRVRRSPGDFIIVCFDVRSEKFKFVEDTQLLRCPPLINYNGKLASLGPKETIDASCTSIKLRVLEDVEKQEWSEHIYVLPDLWKNVVGDTTVCFVGVTRTNEIVLCSSALQCLLYYNTDRNTIIRVEIQGMEPVKNSQIFTLQDHVEDVNLMEVF